MGGHPGDRRGSIADRCCDRTASRPSESSTGAKLERGRHIHLPKCVLYKPEPGTVAIARRLRDVLLDQLLEHPQPIEGDQAERQLDLIVEVARERGRLIGDPGDDPQKRQLVCRGLGILQDDPAHQR